MKKKFFAALIVAVVATFAGYNVYQSQKMESIMSDLMLANVEALATPEQPDVNNCIYDPNVDCIALHPTNPSLDNVRKKARW